MKVSLNWLRALAPGIEGTPEELADRLSMTAVAVDEVIPIGDGIEGVVIGRVEETQPHPNADRLGLATVATGRGDSVRVVVGAPVRPGCLYPYAPPGTSLPGGLEIGARKIRGEISHGMLCSERELGLGRDHSGILELPADMEVGHPLAETLGLPDHVLELDLTPNRADLAGHLAVARELAPDGCAGLRLPSFGAAADTWGPTWEHGDREATTAGVRVVIEDPSRCLRFLGVLIRGVRVGPSPAWLAARLWAIGGRPINNVVDATNYVMHELNHPLHAYDLALLSGPEIRVRGGIDGERLRTLDGEGRTLSRISTVIADADRVVGLAGVMGGEDTEVSSGTTDVFLECAVFDPLHTRRTARQAGLSTDASYRFERGVDSTDVEAAITRCARLILATAGGAAEERALRVGELPGEPPVVELRPSRVRQVLGRRFERGELAAILAPVGFEPVDGEEGEEPAGGAPLRVTVPGWRNDVTREIDLVEEVARRYGYDRFDGQGFALRPSRVPDDPAWAQADRARRLFVARGFLEARSTSFVTVRRAAQDAVELRNPLSAEEGRLRTDLLATLLDRLEYNLARGSRDVRLFEIGTAFARNGAGETPDLPLEDLRAAFVMTGVREPVHWSRETTEVDVWDLKGLVCDIGEGLLGASAVPLAAISAPPASLDSVARWLEGERFVLVGEGEAWGLAGRVARDAVDGPGRIAPVWAGEFRLAGVRLGATAGYTELSPYPRVHRDLALVVASARPVAELESVILGAAPSHLESLRLFDVYEGGEIPSGSRSLAWRFRFRAPDRTLTDQEVDAAMSEIISALEEKSDARIRQA